MLARPTNLPSGEIYRKEPLSPLNDDLSAQLE